MFFFSCAFSQNFPEKAPIRDSSQNEILRFDPINTAVSLTDPFSSLQPGDSGGGLFTKRLSHKGSADVERG